MKKLFINSAAALLLAAATLALGGAGGGSPAVRLMRVPNGGIQPQAAIGPGGTLHLTYFKGDPAHGDIFYVTSRNQGRTFSSPIRVNSQAGSAIAIGTIRGPRLALGGGGRVYVAWNGSSAASPKGLRGGAPMLFTRLNASKTGFEPQRDLMKLTFGLDGGGSVAADGAGNVYVAWHGKRPTDPAGEAGRSAWIRRSQDRGRDFTRESRAWSEPTGACSCCGIAIFAARDGAVYILYRSARQMVHRDLYLLASRDHGKTFRGRLLDKWTLGACPMSSADFSQGPGFVDVAWQTQSQVYFAKIDPGTLKLSPAIAAPGKSRLRKYPALSVNSRGDTLLVWTNDAGWGQTGSLGWQVFGRNGKPIRKEGSGPAVAAWSFGTAFARPDGGFTIVY
ncbi:MAG: hypothetical protein ACRD3D_14835 [Terriglobia bacterium]